MRTSSTVTVVAEQRPVRQSTPVSGARSRGSRGARQSVDEDTVGPSVEKAVDCRSPASGAYCSRSG